MSEDLLEQLGAWRVRTAPALERSGYVLELASSPSTPKPAAWTTLTSAERIGRLTVWVTGEVQLSLGDSRTGHVVEEHRDIHRERDLPDATDALVGWVVGTDAD